MNILAVFLGGGIGSVFRWGVSRLMEGKSIHFPLATLIANVLSCMILAGAVLYILPKIQQSEFWQAFIVIGVCGGFSTFSTFSNESVMLLKNGWWGLFLLNISLNILFCFGLLYLFYQSKK